MTEYFNKINYLGKVSDLCSSSFSVMVPNVPFGIEDYYISLQCLLNNNMNYANKQYKYCFKDYSTANFIFIAKTHLFCDFFSP